MHSVFSILFNTILLFGSPHRNLAEKSQQNEKVDEPKTPQSLTVNVLTDANIEDFVPMERMVDTEFDYYDGLLNEMDSNQDNNKHPLPANTQLESYNTKRIVRKIRSHRHIRRQK